MKNAESREWRGMPAVVGFGEGHVLVHVGGALGST